VYVVSRKAPVFAVALAAGDMKRVKDLFMAEVEAGAYEVDYWPGGHGKERSVAMPEPKGWVCRFVMWWGDYAVYRYEAGKG
jgi:hypothetical protein